MTLHNCMAYASFFYHANYKLFSKFCLYRILRCKYFVYFKSKKELNCNRFVDPNILGAVHHLHSDLRIYRILFFLLDLKAKVGFEPAISEFPSRQL